MMQRIHWSPLTPLVVAGALGLAGCDFDVDNPGRVLESDLNTLEAIDALVTGMSSDFSVQYDGIAFTIARATDDMAGSGSYNETNFFRQGVINAEDVNGIWNGIQRARWVAEDGIRRMRDEIEGYEFAGSRQTARAYLFAGLANRAIGESFCYGVVSADAPLGGGSEAEQPPSAAFQRALSMLEEAVNHATQAGAQDLVDAAHGGRAQAYVGLGDWTNAVLEAGMVPTSLDFDAIYSDNSGRENNEIYNETFGRPEMSAYDTYASTFDPPDPRAPYTNCPVTGTCSENGADGITPYWRQEKYDDRGSEIPAVKGTEMRLIEAEAALRDNDLPTAISKMNEVRAEFSGLTDLTPAPATIEEGWIALDHERFLTLWLEGRRMHDLRRWDAEGRDILPGVQFLNGVLPLAGDELYPGITKRASCIPIAFSECLSNPNLSGSAACSL
jgi:hypothetical protein